MDDVVAELRERLQRRRMKPSLDVVEDRLQRGCLDSTGHLMVTGSNRVEIHAILARVLDAVQPLSTIRTLAVDTDPNATVDRVIATFDPNARPHNYLDRRAALLELLGRAEQAEKSIFVIVDDADHATIEQLENLRASLEVAPEAIERLRLVLIGDATLPRKLEAPAARALRTRIATTVSVDDTADFDAAATPRHKTAVSHALTLAIAATVVFCTAVYAMYLVGLVTGGNKSTRVARSPKMNVAPQTRAAAYAIRGDEPFLDTPLRIDAASAPQKRVVAPAPPRAVAPHAAAPLAKSQAPAAATKAAPAPAARATAKPAEPAEPAKTGDAGPSRGSSIDAFMKRFPAGR